jgi:hypothetical protein
MLMKLTQPEVFKNSNTNHGFIALIPVLVKAIQELSAQNAELTTRIEALEG